MLDQNVVIMYIFCPVIAVLLYCFVKVISHFKW